MFENKMTKDLLNGIKIVVNLSDALTEEVFPVTVGIDSYGKIISKIKINNFSELKKIEDYWSQFNFPQYELINKPLKDLGYN